MAKTDNSLSLLTKYSDIMVAVGVIMIVVMMIIPLPTWLLSLLIVFNISLALIILLVAMYNEDPLQFSIFPALLLIMTLFRLALNVSSTRLILLEGDAGEVIEQFGNFVVGGNPIVGLIVFLILVLIQFIVITKGSERVAEVAARFTLDAMPGKQMAIDADLNAGLINDIEARQRRIDIQRQADFYGAMDGATKFVKGDAIAGIVITLINITGGIIIGTFQLNMGSIGEVAVRFTLLTVGDGLVSQIPALLLSTATGIIVTKAASDANLGSDMVSQILDNPKVLTITGIFLFGLAAVPGLPFFPFATIGGFLIYIAYVMRKTVRESIEKDEVDEIEAEVEETKKPENVFNLLNVDTLELELGYGLIPLVDANQGGDLLDRVILIRRQIAIELGIVVPPVRIRDNMQLEPNKYLIKLKGVVMAEGELLLDRLLAMNPGEELQLAGTETLEPAFGLPALWIEEKDREEAEISGCTVVDPPSVLSTHLTEFIKNHATEIISRQDVQNIINHVKETSPSVVDEVIPRLLSLSEVHRIIVNLLSERVPVRDMVTIFEAIGDYSGVTKDLDILTEYVRQSISRQIINSYIENNTLNVITLSPETEKIIRNSVQETDGGNYLALEPRQAQSVANELSAIIEKNAVMGLQPAVLTPPIIRLYFRRLIERNFPSIPVLSYNEIPQNVNIEVVGTVNLK
ncbi:MAG: flagellar biosynthesis protein FlhA [Clostridia bacterium]|nr:flagellar biosynthesis protein FlhA [Clostridia bacterium]